MIASTSSLVEEQNVLVDGATAVQITTWTLVFLYDNLMDRYWFFVVELITLKTVRIPLSRISLGSLLDTSLQLQTQNKYALPDTHLPLEMTAIWVTAKWN